MMKIGFIDYYLDEWHANNYIPWIKKQSKGELDVTMAYGDIDPEGKLTTEQWCRKNGVENASSIDELVESSDGIIVLSPDNPEQHLRLSEKALQSGKPVYVDKTFANSLEDAKAMFSAAEKHSTPMYSTSALRYAQELGELDSGVFSPDNISTLAVRGPGKYDNYSVHQLEMIVKLMGPGAESVTYVGSEEAPSLVYEMSGGRTAFLHHIGDNFSAAMTTKSGTSKSFSVEKDFWAGFTGDLVSFFKTGKPPVGKAETLEVIAMYEAGMKALSGPHSAKKI